MAGRLGIAIAGFGASLTKHGKTEMTTEREQILALAGEPIAYYIYDSNGDGKAVLAKYVEDQSRLIAVTVVNLYTADQVLAALRSLGEEIKRLMKSNSSLQDALNDALHRKNELRQRVAELERGLDSAYQLADHYRDERDALMKQRDELLAALVDIQQVACSGSPELGIASDAIASVKEKA